MIFLSKKKEKVAEIELPHSFCNTKKVSHCFLIVCESEPKEVQESAKQMFEQCVKNYSNNNHWIMFERDGSYFFNKGETIVENKLKDIAFIKNPDYAFKIISMISKLIAGKKKPKDVCMPIRAAMDANIIRRPTYDEFLATFGNQCPKSSFSEYTNIGYNFDGGYYENMVEDFKKIVTE